MTIDPVVWTIDPVVCANRSSAIVMRRQHTTRLGVCKKMQWNKQIALDISEYLARSGWECWAARVEDTVRQCNGSSGRGLSSIYNIGFLAMSSYMCYTVLEKTIFE